MKKLGFLLIILSIFLLSGCIGNMTPSEKVENMLSRYIKNDSVVLDELNEYIEKQNLTEEQKERYKNIITNEYSTIKYAIKNENIDGDEAKVEVSIEVKDLYKASKEAGDYLMEHPKEFQIEGVYDESKFKDYKLDVMEKNKDTVKYNILLDLYKKDGIWIIDELDTETLEKIHGIYDYELGITD